MKYAAKFKVLGLFVMILKKAQDLEGLLLTYF